MENHNEWLTRGTKSALHSLLLTSGPSPICLSKAFHARHVYGKAAQCQKLGCHGHEVTKDTVYAICATTIQDYSYLSSPKRGHNMGGARQGGAPQRGRAVRVGAGRDSAGCKRPRFDAPWQQQFTCRIQNTDTPRAGRVGRRMAERLGGAGPAGWDADGFVRAGHNRPSSLQGIEDNCPEHFFEGTNLTSPKPGHTTGGSGRGAGWGSWVAARQDRTPTEQIAQEVSAPRTFQCMQDTSSEHLPRSTNKRNPMQTVEGTKFALDQRWISGLFAVYQQNKERFVFLAADQCNRRPFVFVKCFHVRHVREPNILRFFESTTERTHL